MIEYGYTVRWDGGNTVSATGCTSIEEAKEKAWQFAIALGYKPPKWWQFWRYNEATPPALKEPASSS